MLKSGIYDFVICRGGTDMCFVLGFGRKRPDLKQYRISGLTAAHHPAPRPASSQRTALSLAPGDVARRLTHSSSWATARQGDVLHFFLFLAFKLGRPMYRVTPRALFNYLAPCLVRPSRLKFGPGDVRSFVCFLGRLYLFFASAISFQP